jgi:hypothetical protein
MTNQPIPSTEPAVDDKAYMQALYRIFNTFALDDQRNFYVAASTKHRAAARQVNQLRAGFAFLTGLASALAGVLVATALNGNGECLAGANAQAAAANAAAITGSAATNCSAIQGLVVFLLFLTVVMPALAAAFNILSDLYQWDRLIAIYDAALENIELADARSPVDEMDPVTYRASLRAFTEGTLGVMADETAQWGQMIRTPPQLETFLENEQQIANRASAGPGQKTDATTDAGKPAG